MANEREREGSWTERDYYRWFNGLEPEYWKELSADKERTTPKERQFLFQLGRLSQRGNVPTIKQLQWAKSIIDSVDSQKVTEKKREKLEGEKTLPELSESKHVTVRMAWHDNNWNGHICLAPEKNDYCVGEYSLLSRRIRQRKRIEKEKPNEVATTAFYAYAPRDSGEFVYECDEENVVSAALEAYEDRLKSFFTNDEIDT